jgi:hypothetical protein
MPTKTNPQSTSNCKEKREARDGSESHCPDACHEYEFDAERHGAEERADFEPTYRSYAVVELCG